MATTAEIQAERALSAAYSTMPVVKNPDNAVAIQFVNDGFSAFGRVWIAGEILAVERDTASWETTVRDDEGSWLELDEHEQELRFGRRLFRPFKLEGPVLPKPVAKKKAAAPAATVVEPDPDLIVVDDKISFEDPDAPEGVVNTTPASNPLLRKKK